MAISIADLAQKKNHQKIVCLTAYSFPIAKILDEFCDIILVGDSLGMAVYGMPDTVEVTLEMMIAHGKAVRKAVKKSFLVVDLPFGTYEKSPSQALESAKKLISETGCDAIKIETSLQMVKTVEFLVTNKIPVMGHVGLLPQSIRKIGSYRYQGRNEDSAKEILTTAKLVAEAGAFGLVIEAVPAKLADEITKAISIPTIGIGASAGCDGQVLVIDDLLGLNQEFKPRFVRNYAGLAAEIGSAVKKFSYDVKSQKFPAKENLM